MRKLLILFVCFAVFLASCGSGGSDEAVTSITEIATVSETEAATTEFVPEPVIEPTLYTLSFVAAGDNMAYFGNVRDAERNAKGTGAKYDFKPSYTTVKPYVEQFDIAFINQETLMCGEGFDLSYYPRFNVPQELGDAVVDAGFDIIGLANNHMLDKGASGLSATLDYWDSQPITHIGAYRNSEQFEQIKVIEKNGITVALLSFTYGTNGLKLPASSELYIPYIDNETVARKVAEAESLADVTVVSIHWGNEYTFKVNSQQTEVAKIICENGGDVIIGHHPHIIQPVKWIEEGGNKTLCAYSLGNFMSEMEKDYKILGALLSFDIEKLGENGKAEIKNVLFNPTVFDFTTRFYDNHIYFLEDYTDKQAKNHGIGYYGNSTTLEKLYGYVKDNIDAEFLPEFLKAE